MMAGFINMRSLLSGLMIIAALSIAAAEPEHASVQGRYSGLVQKVPCPGDRDIYGQFHDYGWWSGPVYCGSRVASGWWVYAHPFWYVWSRNREMPVPNPRSASLDGKYGGLVMAVICPQDRADYGDFNDWGYWGGGASYCGQAVTAGYWVYRFPYWYIWRVINL
jgi:hypothetical protein